MYSNHFRLAVIILCLGIMLALLWRPAPPDSFKNIQQTGTLRVGYAPQYPYIVTTNEQQVSGLSADIIRGLAPSFDIKQIQWIAIPEDQLVPALIAKQIDLVAASNLIDGQQTRLQLSDPILTISNKLLYSTMDSSYSFLTSSTPHINIGVLSHFTDNLASKLPYETVFFPTLEHALNALDQQAIRGVIAAETELQLIVDNYPADYTVMRLPSQHQIASSQTIHFGFSAENTTFSDAWDEAFRHWLDQNDYVSLLEQYGFHPMQIPSSLKTLR